MAAVNARALQRLGGAAGCGNQPDILNQQQLAIQQQRDYIDFTFKDAVTSARASPRHMISARSIESTVSPATSTPASSGMRN